MQDVISFDTKKQHKTNTCRVKFSQLFFLLTLFIAIVSVPATGFAQVSPYPDEISGEASVEVADDFETGKATYRYFIVELQPKTNIKSQGRSRSLSRTEVFFSGKAHEQFKTGKKVKVRGKRRSNGRGIDFDSLESLEPEPEPALGASNAEASSEAAVASPQIRKILTLLVSFQDADVTVGANAPNLQDVKNIMFHNAQNVSHFYDRASLGTLTIPSDPNGTGGDAVYGPYTIDYTFLDGDPALCDVNSWQDAALTAWENDTGYSRSDYRHHSFIFPNYWDYGSNRNCGWAGYANVGCGTSCWAFNADPVSILHGVIVHELGHNFSFGHARTDPDNDGVKDVEYGDLSDMMGSSRNWMKFNPPHHEYVGWYDPVSYELRTVPPSSTLQSFDLIPVDESDTDWPGLRSLKTARDDSSSYYLSYRRQAGHYNEVTSSYTTGVSLHWRFNSGSDAYASYFIGMIEPGEIFVDPSAGLIVMGIGPSAIDDGSGNSTTVFTVEVCNDTCDTLMRPINLVAQGAYPDTILLAWEDNSYGEDGFTIEYSVDGSIWSSLDSTAADATDYVHSGLSAGTTYYYRVQAYRGASEASEFSGTSSATTPPASGVFAFPIISGDDDVEQMSSDGQMYFTSGDIDLGLDSWADEQHLEGLRFQNISIPQGSTVSSAYIRYRASGDGTGSSTITIRVEDTANAPEFPDSDYYLDGLDFSATTIPWILGDWSYLNYYDTPDLTALVQPIINKTGWVGGNSIAFVNQGTQTGTHAAYAFNSTSGNNVPATLYIDYTWNPTANQPPVAAFTFDCTDLDCSFTDTSADGDGTIVSWLWDFGDINTSSDQNPVHTYAIAGIYNVSLTVTDSDGATDNVIFPVTTQLVSRGPYLQTLTEDSIIVRWRTELATDSVVRYGLSDADLSSTATVGGMTTEHTVTLTDLSPQTEYFYSIGDSGATFEGDASFHFTTAPAAGTSVPTRFWVIGDSGTADANARAVRDRYKDYAAATKPSEFMLMLGDNAYNDGFDSEYQAAVFDTYPVLLRQLPVWPTLGNHDGHQADSATQTGPYYDIFDLPTAGEAGGLASGTEAYYSYDYGDIHFVVLDSYETDRSAGGNMMSWLEADLVINDKPWIIAFWHHPPYTKGSHDSDTEGQLIDMRQNALPLLEAYGVDLVLSGHSHSYERSMLLDGHYGGSTTLDVASMVLNAGAGRVGEPGDAYEKPGIIAAMNEGAVYAVAGSSGKISGGNLDHPAMYISLNVLGSMVVDVDDDQLDAVFIDHLGEIRDEFTILKTTDVDAPQLSGVRPEDVTHVLVDSTERLDSSSAETVANYSIGAVSISAAELLPGGTSVRLTVSTLTPGAYYLLTVNNVLDENSNVIAANSQAGFYYVLPTTVNFQASGFDASFREANPTVNYGSAEFLEVDGGTSNKHVLIGWDLSSIPANALIESASIHLTIFDVSTGSFTCNVMMTDWVESEVTWDNASAGVPWATPGATGVTDRGSEVLCDTFGAGSSGPLTINLNTPGIAQVQRWIDGTDPNNYGFMLGNPTSSDGADFRSREWGTAAERPRFEVTYSVSVPAPNSPTGLEATPVSPTQINLDWVDNSINESGFQIELSPNGSTAWSAIASVGPNVTTYSNTGLSQATTYYYRVYAKNVGGDSAFSNVAGDTTLSYTYTVGGVVSGLVGSGLVLQNNAVDNMAIGVDGTFEFSTALDDGSAYAVTVSSQPASPNQTCSVDNASGNLAGANVTNVAVSCATHCNVNSVAGVEETTVAAHEACEILVAGPLFTAKDGASVTLSSGWEIYIMPGFTVELGASLQADVCGQSLCMISAQPMPDGCHSCVDLICDVDPACCDTEFDQACLDKVDTICGLECE